MKFFWGGEGKSEMRGTGMSTRLPYESTCEEPAGRLIEQLNITLFRNLCASLRRDR